MFNLITYQNSRDTLEIDEDNFLVNNTVNIINKKYNIKKSVLSKKIKNICFTNDLFSILNENNNVIFFGDKIMNFKNITNIFSNQIGFCGVNSNNNLIFWKNNKIILTNVFLTELNNVVCLNYIFAIFESNNLHIINSNWELMTFHDINNYIYIFNLIVVRCKDMVIFIKKDSHDIKQYNIDNKLLSYENPIKMKLIDKMLTDKQRFILILKKSVNNLRKV